MEQEKRKKRKLSKVMEGYVKKELDHRGIEYTIIPGDPNEIETELTNSQFHWIMEDALCMKERAESGSNLPVLSLNMVKNDRIYEEKAKELSQPDGSFVFTMLQKDNEAYLNYVMKA